ncbi:MAG TPA: DUF3135 domain-containing protein [Gammaproteobacteria bacterium]|nr:DUF3135 domain-containing protein [Gammaproteobacteria bacterium]
MPTWITNNFDIDWWIKLAAEHPFKFEQQRLQWLENAIQYAPAHQKPRLKGLVWEMNMDLEIARHKLRKCPSISERLVESLQAIKEILEGAAQVYFNPKSADILEFVIPRD